MTPRCTVLVPSYNRLPSVLELLERLRRQDYASFEILIIEQSTRRDVPAFDELKRVIAEDPRIRMELHPPLGVGGARNVGMRSALGEVVLIIDDDDLPATDDWISRTGSRESFCGSVRSWIRSPRCSADCGRWPCISTS